MNLKLQNINKSFGNRMLFNDFSVDIHRGSFCCVYGESGSGKTTLLNMIGLLESYTGKILYNGQELMSKKQKREVLAKNIGFLFQNFGLVDNETVLGNFKLLVKYSKSDLLQIERCLKRVGLDGFLNRYIFELSGGEQQRVAIAKLLYKQPTLILADEPTASLDEDNKHQILKLLQEMNEKGTTIVLVTHDTDIKQYASQVLHLSRK